MRKDYRGRVRFGYDGHRFELTTSGLKIYERVSRYPTGLGFDLRESELVLGGRGYVMALRVLLRTSAGRHKLELALRASRKKAPAKPKQFTTAIHIPPHMRAVRTTNNQTRTT